MQAVLFICEVKLKTIAKLGEGELEDNLLGLAQRASAWLTSFCMAFACFQDEKVNFNLKSKLILVWQFEYLSFHNQTWAKELN